MSASWWRAQPTGRRRSPLTPRAVRRLWSVSWRRQRCSQRSRRRSGGSGGHTHDPTHCEGAGVAGRRHDGARARPVPPGPSGGTALRPGRGASALLRGAHPREGQALPHLGSGSATRRRAAARHPVALSPCDSAGHHRRAADYVVVGTGLGAGQRGGGAAGRARRVLRASADGTPPLQDVALPRTSRLRTLPATSKASESVTGVSAAGRSRGSWVPGATSRYRWPSMTRRSVSSSCWWPMLVWNVNGRAHEHRAG